MSNNPIESISWYDALFFCNKLTHLYMSKDDTVYKLKEIIRDKRVIIKSCGLPKKAYK